MAKTRKSVTPFYRVDPEPHILAQNYLELVWAEYDGKAAKGAGVSRMTLWRWINQVKPPSAANQKLMREAVERVMTMTDEERTVYYAGVVGIPVEMMLSK